MVLPFPGPLHITPFPCPLPLKEERREVRGNRMMIINIICRLLKMNYNQLTCVVPRIIFNCEQEGGDVG